MSEVRTINGLGVKDAVAREEIRKLRNGTLAVGHAQTAENAEKLSGKPEEYYASGQHASSIDCGRGNAWVELYRTNACLITITTYEYETITGSVTVCVPYGAGRETDVGGTLFTISFSEYLDVRCADESVLFDIYVIQ